MTDIHQPRSREELDALLLPRHLNGHCVEVALGQGAAEARTWGAGAPAAAPEYARWARTVEHLHNELMASGIKVERRNPQNLPVWIHVESGHGLVVSSGDSYTGLSVGISPRTRNPKGARFLQSVSPSGQASFFRVVAEGGDIVDLDDMWVLLYHETDGVVSAELSSPMGVESGRIVSWTTRILMPPYDISTNSFSFEDSGYEQELGFILTRRA
jgi:hypothetical protein